MKPLMRTRHVGFTLIGLVALLLTASCSKAPTPPAVPAKMDPETELTFAPVQYDTTTFRVHFFWNGFDDDGEVMRFYYAVDNDTLLPPTQWRSTVAKDTTLLFLVDPVKELKVHVFKVSAVDNEGRYDQTPASRAFSAKTIPPTSRIEKGPSAFNPTIGPNFTFEWSGIDPDGGETGGKAPVDSFQFMLLRVGATSGNPANFDPLPPWNQDRYTLIINSGTGDALPVGTVENHDRWSDWQWQGIRGLKFRFRNVTPGEYVFVERAVDIAGATEKNLKFPGPQGPNSNIRHFTVTSFNAGPRLTVRSSILNRPLDSATGPEDFARKQLQIFEGETVSFSWSATAEDYGGEIVGYTYALDDTSTFQGIDLRLTGATFQPSVLPPGPHFLYVRAVDDGGLVTNLVLPLLIVHPNFKDAGWPRGILFVDDSVPRLGNGSAPTDATENNWWLTRSSASGDGPLYLDGLIPHTEWDTTEQSEGGVEGRKQPDARTLADYTTVVWASDAENGGSVASGLFKTVAGGDYSELQGYLRAGGTLILTGWHIAWDTSGSPLLTVKGGAAAPNGICAAFAEGSVQFDQTRFPRMFMGIDNSVQNQVGLRSAGAADFVRANPTPAAVAMGFDTARVDTGNDAIGVQYPDNSGSGQPTFKWNTKSSPPPFNPDLQSFPGIHGIEGWIMARNFACKDIQDLDVEPSTPLAQVLYTYHGVRMGPLQDGGPSPREGLAVGAFYASHDLGTHSGPYDPTAAIGRIAIFTFPLYYLKDDDAIGIMKKSFTFVNASPTLP